MYEVVQGFRLSPQQRRLWQWRGENAALRSWCVVRIEGVLDLAVLRRAMETVIARHEVLRTSFYCPADVDLPLQRIAAQSTPAWRVEDLTTLGHNEQETRIAELAQMEHRFDFEQGPLLWIDCVILSPRKHALVLTLPSLCADNLTLRNLVHDLGRCYQACRNETDGLPEPTQYVQFSEWQNELQEEEDDSGRNYWRNRIDPESVAITLPYEKKNRVDAEFVPDSVVVSLPHELTRDFLLACWETLLWRLTGREKIVVAVQFEGRKYEELSEALGLFAKCVLVQADFTEDAPLSRIVESAGESCRDAEAWQEYFDWDGALPVHFSYEEWTKREHDGDLQFSIAQRYSCIEPYKLKLDCLRTGETLSTRLEFDRNAFAVEHVQLIARCFETLVQSAVANPKTLASDLEILSERDTDQLLVWSRSSACEIPQQCIQQLFEEQAARSPDAPAVVYNGLQLSYAQLNARANKLAHYLRRRGIGPNAIVGLCLHRSLEMLVAMWAILKAGAAYLPVDPEHPPARIAYQLAQSESPMLLTQESLLDHVGEFDGGVVCLDRDCQQLEHDSDENPSVAASPEDLAYVIFTSGSTGQPKGVQITHANLVNYSSFIARTFSFNAEPLQFATVSTLSADLGNTCIFPALISGGCLHVLDYEIATDADRFADYLHEQPIDVLKIVPSHLNALLPLLKARDVFPRKYLILGGEVLSFDLLQRIREAAGNCRIVNHYGPTETTIGSLIYPIDEGVEYEEWSTTVPIGRPIANTEIYLLDERRRLVPPGLTGELYIGGAGVANGYLRQPEQTNTRFIQNRFSSDSTARLYRTGDLARYLPDGNVEFLGRVDHQVKIRGYRIELGEIENVLREHANIREAIVQAREDEQGHKRLVAYYVSKREPAPASVELTNTLKQKLPAYMVPQIFIALQKLPLTRNGKVARELLPEPNLGGTTTARALPRTEAEKNLAAIWKEVLGVLQVGINDNFFELGGDSVLGIQIIARARRVGLSISPKQIFEHPTIAALAQVAGTITTVSVDDGPVIGEAPLLPIQHWFFERELPHPHHYNQAFLLEVKQPLAFSAVEQIVRELLLHHDALRLRFVREETHWRQTFAPPESELPLVPFDLSTVPQEEVSATIEAEAAKLQSSFDLATGPLVRVAYFDLGANRPARLLLTVHHLVVDGVSWRILVEDLVLGWEMAGRGEKIVLPARTTSLKAWAERLARHSQSLDFQQHETSYWLAEARQSARPLLVDFQSGENTLASAHTIATRFNEQETHALLHEAPAAYHTQINDLLLTALVQACARWSGNRSLLVDLEGHGREQLFDDIDLSRTVGWFTTHFPVFLKLDEAMTTGEALRTIKEQLRQVPNHGIGYGMLRYLSDDAALVERLRSLPQAEVSFNYLGQFDQVLSENAPFKLAPEKVAETQSRRGKLSHLLRVNANVSNGQLQVLWTYSRNVYEQATIEKLGGEFQRALQTLIADCLSAKTAFYTPSDFPDADLSQKDLDVIVARLNGSPVDDIYTLSPMQEGMLYQSLYNREGDAYFRQMSFTIQGELNFAAFAAAWERVIERHPPLRSSFFWDGIDRPVQVVQQRVTLPLEVVDWRDLSPQMQEGNLKTYLLEEQSESFALEQAPLLRLTLIRLRDDLHQFVWNYHHILIDGWSRAIIYQEALALYAAICEGREAELELRRPYRDYIRWLRRQDLSQAERFWRNKFRGFVAPALLGKRPSSGEHGDFTVARKAQISEKLTDRLKQVSRQHQLTLSTLVYGMWSVIVAGLSGEREVVFGTVVSGRSIDLEGSQSMVGPFLNTLPLRVSVDPSQSVLSWLSEIQQQQLELREFEYSPLVEIERWSGVPRGRRLFETAVNYTNYHVDSSLRRPSQYVEVKDVNLVERMHQAIALAAEPGIVLTLSVLYDSRRFDETAIESILAQLESGLNKMADGLEFRLEDLLSERADSDDARVEFSF